LGIPPTTGRILARAYPRAAPGRLRSLVSDPATGRVEVSGRAAGGSCALDLWAPSPGIGLRPTFTGSGIDGVAVTASAGGWRVTGCAHGDWSLRSGAPVRVPRGRSRCGGAVRSRRGYLTRRCARYVA
jgi:hypothetical protein